MSANADFNSANLAQELEALSDEARDQLDFGVVKLDMTGNVIFYSLTEARKSGFKRRPAIGRNFFLEIAPCMNRPEMKGRIDSALSRGKVDVEIGWVGDFDDPDGEIRIRTVSASDGGLWIALDRPSAD